MSYKPKSDKTHYKRLGDYIELVKEKNKEGIYDDLRGINIDKFFMPSVANVVGVDLNKYKIIKKNQFACNRMHVGRDYRIPIALSKEDTPFIVSPAYDVFEIIDNQILLEDYLMMWFSRKEFDRNAWYYTDADVRGGLAWHAFCNIKLPIPSIEKQRDIVAEYNAVDNRIRINEQLNQKLEETAQTIYKHWFVDFEFPNENGQPYKTSGGAMLYNDELDKEIPEGWEVTFLNKLADFQSGFSYKGIELVESNDALLTIKNFSKQGVFKTRGFKEIKSDRIKDSHFVKEGDVVVAHTDLTKGFIIGKSIIILDSLEYDNLIISMDTVKVTSKLSHISNSLLNQMINDKEFSDFSFGYVNGSTVLHLSKKALGNYKLAFPKEKNFVKTISEFLSTIVINQSNFLKQESKLNELKDLLLTKMSKVI